MKKYLEAEDKKLKDREKDFAKRLKKIQDKMDCMANTVVRDENEKRLKEEKRVLQLQEEKELNDIRTERERKQKIFEHNININQ